MEKACYISSRSIILVFLASLSLFNKDVGAAPRWNRQTVELRQGEDLTLICSVTGLKLLDAVRISKMDPTRQSTETSIAIADNDNIKFPFSKFPRYRITYDFNHGTAITTLQYNGIRGEDAGLIGCHSLSDEQNMAVVNLTVYVPLGRVSIVPIKSDIDGQNIASDDNKGHSIITLKELEETGVSCIANITGSLTPPDVTIQIDGIDRTNLFTVSKLYMNIDGDFYNGIGTFYGETKLSYVSRKPHPEFDGKTMTCLVSKTQGSFGDRRTATAQLFVQYTPRVTCTNYEIYARTGETVLLECDVKSKLRSYISWNYDGIDRSKLNIATDNKIQMVEKVVTSSHKRVTLTIKSILDVHFTTFRLTAKNEVGENEVLLYVVDRDHPLEHAGLQARRLKEEEERNRAMPSHSSSSKKCEFIAPLLACLLSCLHVFALTTFSMPQ